MTLQALPSPLIWPGMSVQGWNGVAGASAGSTLDAAGEYQGIVCCAQQDMTISHVLWRPHAVSGSPTADVRIETVGATGLPSGTLWATNTNIVTGTLTAAFRTDALTASASITKGQMFAVIFQYNSGTSFQARLLSTGAPLSKSIPYRVTNTGVPAKGLTALPIMALGSSSTAFYPVPGLFPTIQASAAFNNTNSAARGNKFTVPFACRVIGLSFNSGANLGDYNIFLADSSGTELSSSSTAFDGDHAQASAGYQKIMFFDNAVTVTAGTTVIGALEPSSATNSDEVTFDLSNANDRTAMPGGTGVFRVTRTSGVWSDDTDSVTCMDLVIDQLDDGAGSGGGISRARAFGGFA